MSQLTRTVMLIATFLVITERWSFARSPGSPSAPATSSSCSNQGHLVDRAVFDSIWEVDNYLTPNTMNKIGPPYTPVFPTRLPLLRLVHRCPDLRDDAVRGLAAKTDDHSEAYDAIILANLLPRPEDAVREVVRAIPPAVKQSNVLVDVTAGCVGDHHYGPCGKMKAAIRAENGGRIPEYPWR